MLPRVMLTSDFPCCGFCKRIRSRINDRSRDRIGHDLAVRPELYFCRFFLANFSAE